jgi:hypothetical protein
MDKKSLQIKKKAIKSHKIGTIRKSKFSQMDKKSLKVKTRTSNDIKWEKSEIEIF